MSIAVSVYLARLRAGWRWLLGGAFLCGLVFYLASYLFSPVYTATAVVTPSDSVSQNLNSQLGLAGVGLSSALGRGLLGAGPGDRSTEYETILTSEEFSRRVLLERGWVPILFPAGWDPASRSWKNEGHFSLNALNPIAWLQALKQAIVPERQAVTSDVNSRIAKLENALRAAGGPPLYEAVKRFQSVVNVDLNDRTGFITITATLKSPTDAQMVVQGMVDALNKTEQDRTSRNAKAEVDYLKAQITGGLNETVRDAYIGVLERQLKIQMLSAVAEDYAVREVVTPVIPQVKSAPMRRLYFVFGFLLGFLIMAGIELREMMLTDRPPEVGL